MDVRPIRNESDYDWALGEIELYFEHIPEPGTPAADRFDILAALIEAYENRQWRVEAPDPIEVLKTVMADSSRSQADLAELIGSSSRASEILRRKRRLTLDMVHRISRAWYIPADLLVVPYATEDRAA